MTRQRILVTGAGSPLGQAVGRRLNTEGHIGIGTTRGELADNPLPMFDHLVHLDLQDPETIDNLNVDFDSVIHVASSSVGNAAHLMEITGIATSRLADAAIRRGAKNFIHVSSMSVYGAVAAAQVSAKTQILHSSPYGVAKWAAECYLSFLGNQLPAVSVRSCAIVGQRSHRHFLAETLAKMTRQEPRVSLSNPEFLFNNVIHEDTLAAFLVHLGLTHEYGYSAVPVGSSEPIWLKSVIAMMAERTKFSGVIDWIPAKSPAFSIDITGAVDLGLDPMTTITTVRRWLENEVLVLS